MSDKAERFKRIMARQQARVAASMALATAERGLILLLTGEGKGKTTAAFGTVMRALGYGQKVAVVQFIKGTQASGEEILLRERFPEVSFYQMGTGFTWDSQNFEADKAAAEQTWRKATTFIEDKRYQLVVLDELTYMFSFGFLDEAAVLTKLVERPPGQHIVITGRGGGSRLREMADTVSEVKSIRHAYEAGVKAQRGLDF